MVVQINDKLEMGHKINFTAPRFYGVVTKIHDNGRFTVKLTDSSAKRIGKLSLIFRADSTHELYEIISR